MKPCIFESPKHRIQVANLVKHCRDLDGTEVQVFRWEREPEGMGYPEICNAAFLWVAKIERKPFIWLEHDSIPLRSGWSQRLEKEYERMAKPLASTTPPCSPTKSRPRRALTDGR